MAEKPTHEELQHRIRQVEQNMENLSQSEEALRESEKQYRTLIDNLPVAVYRNTPGPKGKYLMANPAFCKMFGFENEEEVKRITPSSLYQNPEERKKYSDSLIKKGEIINYERTFLKKDGTPIHTSVTSRVVYGKDGKVSHFDSILLNITEQKLAEEALRESEERYRTILESIEEAYFEVDLAGNFTFFNDSLCDLLSYPRDELEGMNNRDFIATESSKKIFNLFNQIYRTGKPVKNVSYEIIRKDGSKGFHDLSASLMRDKEGRPVGFRGIARDVTELKLAEEERKRMATQLQHAQRMEAIGTLAGGIAHNFNNLLMGIMGYTSLILLDIDPHHSSYNKLKSIEKLIENGSKLTSQLLGYAREGRYEVKPISLNQLVKETAGTLEMTKKDLTVHQDLADKLYGIKADQGQIEQVLLNLYVNAADAMPLGGDLFIKTMNVTHKDMAGRPYKVKPGNYVLLSVEDTGVGMDKEIVDHIFEPFFTTKGLASGTGLGLASAYGIIKGHGGYIDVASQKGHGTTFTIYLPATEKEITEEKGFSDRLVKGKGRILLVDDEETVIDAGGQMLETLGYEVLSAGDGKEALELYRKNKGTIDMVLLDMVMPIMSGGETFDRLKEMDPKVKVLLSSGYSIEGEAKEILNRGCDAFIQKPFRLDHLSQKVKEVLESG
ncbi:MAG: PAS domain S-box protein [Deltaproteobacteria bacterium]|nr:PAS domain S-box protein [Deltaproteobacteria bacterium]